MAKVVIASLKSAGKNTARIGKRPKAVVAKRVRGEDGRTKTLHLIDAASATFGDELRYVFGRSVARARRDNKLKTGSPDGARLKR